MLGKHSDPAYVTFVLEKVNMSKTKPTPPDASDPVKPRTKKPGKNSKRDGYPSDDSYEPDQDRLADKKKKTRQGDRPLTLLDILKEPKVVAVTEPAPKDSPTHTIVLNPGFAITESIRCEREGERPQPQYCLSGDEYKESGWKGVYAKERRRFVYLAQKIYAPGSGYNERQIKEYEESWQEHLTRLLAPAIKDESDIDQDYLALASTRNPTSLAWVIKISLELDKLVKADKFTGSQQAYVGVADKKARKRIFPSANTLKAIKSTMCFSLPDVYHLGLKACERCRVDIRDKGGLYGFQGKRKIGKMGSWVLNLPCAQRMCLVKGLGSSEKVVGTGNCFHCASFS